MRSVLHPVFVAFVLAGLAFASAARAAEAPRVVTSILPINSLVAGVMSGVEEPILLVPPGRNPATYEPTLDELERIETANLFVRLGTRTDAHLSGAISRASEDVSVLTLGDTPGVVGLDEDTPERPIGEQGPALWLDPANAKVWVRAIAETLIELDADNRNAYSANAEGMLARLDALQTEIDLMMRTGGGEARILFEDSLRPFSTRFQVSVDPGTREPTADVQPPAQAGDAPSAEVRGRVSDMGPICIVRPATPGQGDRQQASAGDGQGADGGAGGQAQVSVDVFGPAPRTGAAGQQYYEMLRGVAEDVRSCATITAR